MATNSPYATEEYTQAYSVTVELTWPDGRETREPLRLTLDQWTAIWAAGIPQGDARSFWSQAGAEKVAELAQGYYTQNPNYEGTKVHVYARPGRVA